MAMGMSQPIQLPKSEDNEWVVATIADNIDTFSMSDLGSMNVG